MTTTTYHEILALVRGLDRQARARLVATVVEELAGEAPPVQHVTPDAAADTATDTGWSQWERLRAELSARPAGATSMAEQLERDRHERQAGLEGRDVHA